MPSTCKLSDPEPACHSRLHLARTLQEALTLCLNHPRMGGRQLEASLVPHSLPNLLQPGNIHPAHLPGLAFLMETTIEVLCWTPPTCLTSHPHPPRILQGAFSSYSAQGCPCSTVFWKRLLSSLGEHGNEWEGSFGALHLALMQR